MPRVTTGSRGGVVGGEAVELAVREAVAREEVVGRLALGILALLADPEARRADVLREDVVSAVGTLAHGVLARRLGALVVLDAEGAVVARGRQKHT